MFNRFKESFNKYPDRWLMFYFITGALAFLWFGLPRLPLPACIVHSSPLQPVEIVETSQSTESTTSNAVYAD